MSFYFSQSQQTDFSEATAATPTKSTTTKATSSIAKETPAKSTNTEVKVCPNCAGLSFYTDPTTLQLTCNSCYTQLLTSTNEELDATDGLGIAAQFGNKHLSRTSNVGGSGSSSRGSSSRPKRPLIEYDSSKTLPSVEACISAFQWLLWDASKCISKLISIHEQPSTSSISNPDLIIFDYKDASDKYKPSIFEQTVKQIWFNYLKVWIEATQQYVKKYPELRISYRDYFLEDIRKAYILKHLSISIGKQVEDELLGSIQEKYDTDHEFDDYDEDSISFSGSSIASYSDIDDENWDSSDAESISSSSSLNKKRRLHHISSSRPFLTIAQMYKAVIPTNNKQRHFNGLYKNMHPHHAVLSIQPSLTLLLSILQLACHHLQTGIASHHITNWVSNGQLPHGINGIGYYQRGYRKVLVWERISL